MQQIFIYVFLSPVNKTRPKEIHLRLHLAIFVYTECTIKGVVPRKCHKMYSYYDCVQMTRLMSENQKSKETNIAGVSSLQCLAYSLTAHLSRG